MNFCNHKINLKIIINRKTIKLSDVNILLYEIIHKYEALISEASIAN